MKAFSVETGPVGSRCSTGRTSTPTRSSPSSSSSGSSAPGTASSCSSTGATTSTAAPRPEFELNRPEFAGASILLAGRNFGCGSSREHAAWALQDYGFDVVIAPSFGDIFRTNAGKIGLVTIALPGTEVKRLMEVVDLDTGSEMSVDLERRTIVGPDGRDVPFEIDEATRVGSCTGSTTSG